MKKKKLKIHKGMKSIFGLIGLLLAGNFAAAQNDNNNYKTYPSHWWTGMKHTKLQVIIHGDAIGNAAGPVTISYPGVKLEKTHRVANSNYLFLDLNISPAAKPGNFIINISRGTSAVRVSYTLKPRSKENGKTRIKGISSEDLMYLIMPDRFANGDYSNDRIPGMRDQSLNRDSMYLRHGGDLKGIEDHLGYLQQLGVTALWLNPVIINDMPERTEHGYAFTDHYRICPRLGGEAAYHSLINALHQRGMKIIQDAVYNHTGIEHILFRDLPDSSFFHFWPKYTNTSYKDQALMDPYASEADRKRMSDGWFVPSMPDWNHNNPFVANYLIQHAIWSTEEFGLDGWRIDTYGYNDLAFMNRCNKALLDEYPQLHLFGETWVHGMLNQAFFMENKMKGISYESNLPAVTDFQLNFYGIKPALTEAFGWTEGVNKLYTTTSNDFVYKDPTKNVIFLDNHDVARFFSIVGEDVRKYKMGLSWLLTFRGIPQLYYGAEIGMKGFTNPDGWVRLDFIGGWKEDSVNKFTPGGRNPQEQEIYSHVQTLAGFRKNASALKSGKLMQYVPENGVYVYFRYDARQTVMCIMNTNDKEMDIDMTRFEERTKGFTRLRYVHSDAQTLIRPSLKIPAMTMWVLELK
jgi:neopullulanase